MKRLLLIAVRALAAPLGAQTPIRSEVETLLADMMVYVDMYIPAAAPAPARP